MGARFFSLLVLLVSPSLVLAQDASRDRGRATITVASIGGARTQTEADEVPTRAQHLLVGCADQGRAAHAADDVRVRLEIAADGRARAIAIHRDGGPAASAPFIRWRDCVVRTLGRLRFERGDAGTIEISVRWEEPRSVGAGVVGGFRSRGGGPGGGLPRQMRSEQREQRATPYPRDVLERVVRDHAGEVRRCHDFGIQTRPDLEGTVTARFTIAPDGTVQSAVAESDDLRMPSVTECVLARLRSWTFPPPDDGQAAEVTYPFVLRQH